MFSWNTVIIVTLASSIGVNAQFSGLSTSCQTAAGGFLLGDLGSCLSLTSLVPVLTGSGSIIPSIDSYLGTICTSPPCSNSTLTSAESTIQSSCSSDLNNGSTLVVALDTLLQNYTVVRDVACLQSTTNNTYCITQTLSAIQNATGTQITSSYITSLLDSNSTELNSLIGLDASVLCTSCTKAIYQEISKAIPSIADSTIGKAILSKCGSDFGTGSMPSGVAEQGSSATTSAVASSTSASAARAVIGLEMMQFVAVAGSVVAVLVGASTVLL